MEAEARPRLGLREGENRETQMRERERNSETRRMPERQASPVVVRDLVAASYSHGDSALDKGLVEDRNILNFFGSDEKLKAGSSEERAN